MVKILQDLLKCRLKILSFQLILIQNLILVVQLHKREFLRENFSKNIIILLLADFSSISPHKD